MNSPNEERLLGDYRLKKIIRETPLAQTWLAQQESIGRSVLVDEIRPEMVHLKDEFLANVRAKASLDHPLIASVFEAVTTDTDCYFAHELLPGSSLKERKEAKEPLQPVEMVHVLKRISEVDLQLEAQSVATSPISLDAIHIDSHGVIRLSNLAVGGKRNATDSARDIAYLGKALAPLIADGRAGATRLITLLSWMRGEGIEESLTWEQVGDLCGQIEHQLETPDDSSPGTGGNSRLIMTSIIAGSALLVVLIVALAMRPSNKVDLPERAVLPEAVLIPEGNYVTVDGSRKEVSEFLISAHEVTISEYAEFMKILGSLQKGGRDQVFNHKDQPDEKVSHAPDDWDAMLRSAKSGVLWRGRMVTLDSPVVGVDWWDCMAYAEWKNARLPTQDEWRAALGDSGDAAAKIPASGWAPVNPQTKDKSRHGVLSLAGSVSEWAREPAVNPANPLGARKWVVMGGSYLKKGSNALTVEWVDDRSLRRKDLGFRVIFEIGD